MKNLPVLAILLVVAFSPTWAEQPTAAYVYLANETTETIRIDGGFYVDSDGKRHDISRSYWMLAPGVRSAIQLGDRKSLIAREFTFDIITADGRTQGWSTTKGNQDGQLIGAINDTALRKHRDNLAEARKKKKAGWGTMQILIPDGAIVRIGTWTPFAIKGVALITSEKELEHNVPEGQSIRIEFTSNGETTTEEAEFFLEPGLKLEWDCRDMAAPDKLARTARYVLACREFDRFEREKLGEHPKLEDEVRAMRAVARRIDALPTRSVDEDAVRHNQNLAEMYLKLAKGANVRRAELDALAEDLLPRAQRVRKLLEARYGDAYQKALANGGKSPAPVTTFKPRFETPMEDRDARRSRINTELANLKRSIEIGEKNLDAAENDRAAADLAETAAIEFYNSRETAEGRVAAGVALAIARRALADAEARCDRLRLALQRERLRYNRLNADRDE